MKYDDIQKLRKGRVVYVSMLACNHYGEKCTVKDVVTIRGNTKITVKNQNGTEFTYHSSCFSLKPVFPYTNEKILEDMKDWLIKESKKTRRPITNLIDVMFKGVEDGVVL